MRDTNHLHDAVEKAIEHINQGFALHPESEAYKRIENELYWLLSGNRDPIDDALDKLIEIPVSISVALDLHDLVNQSDDLSGPEKTKLHYAVNLKVTKA